MTHRKYDVYSCYTLTCRSKVFLFNGSVLRKRKTSEEHNHGSAEATYEQHVFYRKLCETRTPTERFDSLYMSLKIIFKNYDSFISIASPSQSQKWPK